MKKILNTIKHLFTKDIFKGENTRLDFFIYFILISIFLVLPATTYLNLENTPADTVNSAYSAISLLALLLGLYLYFINTVRRANMTHFPVIGYIGVVSVIVGQMYGYPLTVLYQLVAFILLVLPNQKQKHG